MCRIASCLLLSLVAAQEPTPKPMPQNPSPMVEHTRAHERLDARDRPGIRLEAEAALPRAVPIFIPPPARGRTDLLVHFHGAAFAAEHAVSQSGRGYVLATVNLGAGSGVYDRTFSDPAAFVRLVQAVLERTRSHLQGGAFSRIVLSGYSAGHGAIRAILRTPRHEALVDGVLLLDGLHTSYVPERTVLAEGGALDEAPLAEFVRFAEAAIAGRKRLLITHSEIFPGTFASTTETADYLLEQVGLRRRPVLEWGPLGMQQLSLVAQGQLRVLGFAGNSAPDHVDHLHAMHHFLDLLDRQPVNTPD